MLIKTSQQDKPVKSGLLSRFTLTPDDVVKTNPCFRKSKTWLRYPVTHTHLCRQVLKRLPLIDYG